MTRLVSKNDLIILINVYLILLLYSLMLSLMEFTISVVRTQKVIY